MLARVGDELPRGLIPGEEYQIDLHLHCFLCFASFLSVEHMCSLIFFCLFGSESLCMRFEFRTHRFFMGPTDRQLVIRRTSSKYKIKVRVLLTGFLHPAKPPAVNASREPPHKALALSTG